MENSQIKMPKIKRYYFYHESTKVRKHEIQNLIKSQKDK